MRLHPDPTETLSDPEVRKFFVDLLNSSMPAEEKYDAFIRFFTIENDLSKGLQAQAAELGSGDLKRVDEAVAEAARSVGAWQPEMILQQVEDSLTRALRRIGLSQHSDGGWGYSYEKSHVWATAWTVLALHRAAQIRIGSRKGSDFIALVQQGQRWLIDHRADWSLVADEIPEGKGNSVYEAAVVLRCLCATGAASLPEIRGSIEGCVTRLLELQNGEGDWESTAWGRGWTGSRVSRREVGATSFALQSLATCGHQRNASSVKSAAARATEWLAGEQNPDGSWNASVYLPHTVTKVPSVNKTCDALKGLLAGRKLGIALEPYQTGIEKAVTWLLHQEQAVFNSEGKITGWAWKSQEGDEEAIENNFLENTCLTLEILLDMETVSLPQLATNALWLLRKQHQDPGSIDDGKWSNNDTGRIACALLEFYRRTKDSPIFQPAAAPQAETPREANA